MDLLEEPFSGVDLARTPHSINIAQDMMATELLEIDGIESLMIARNQNIVSPDVRRGF